MRPGDLLLHQGRGFYSFLIRLSSGSPWTHVDVLLGQGMVAGADFKRGVIERTFQEAVNSSEACRVHRVVVANDVTASAAASFVRKAKDTPYDLGGVFGICSKLLLSRLGLSFIVFWGKNKAEDSKRLFCSELVAEAYEAQGIKLVEHDPSYVTPGDLAGSKLVAPLRDGLL